MPHLKCAECKIRLQSYESPEDGSHACCPACGRSLEPISDLAEVVGFQAVSAEGSRTFGYQRLADRLGHMRRNRIGWPAQPPLDLPRWLEEPDNYAPEALAQALALPPSDPRA